MRSISRWLVRQNPNLTKYVVLTEISLDALMEQATALLPRLETLHVGIQFLS
ncbi:hypothetical protein BG003_007682, partial [Podila horticola]